MSSAALKKPKELLSRTLLNEHQQAAITRLFEHDETLLVAPVGEGKTVVTLTAVQELMADGVFKRVLLTCPSKVCGVWPAEAGKWEHLEGLEVVDLRGDIYQRRGKLNRAGERCVIVCSFDILPWVLEQEHNCTGLVVDETSRFRNSGGESFKKLRAKLSLFTWRVGLTATPVSENFEGLYGQALIVDAGKALGRRKDAFMQRYFMPLDPRGYRHRCMVPEELLAKVAHLMHIMPDTKDKRMPELTEGTITFKLPESARDVYETIRHDYMMLLDDTPIIAQNAAVLTGKLRQVTAGFLYSDKGIVPLHQARLDAAYDWVVSEDEPALLVYEHLEILRELRELFPNAAVIGGGTTAGQLRRILAEQPRIVLLHPKSGGHGVDGLQQWISRGLFVEPLWSNDQTRQTIGRLWRTGQAYPVRFDTLVCEKTIDETIMERLGEKITFDRILRGE